MSAVLSGGQDEIVPHLTLPIATVIQIHLWACVSCGLLPCGPIDTLCVCDQLTRQFPFWCCHGVFCAVSADCSKWALQIDILMPCVLVNSYILCLQKRLAEAEKVYLSAPAGATSLQAYYGIEM